MSATYSRNSWPYKKYSDFFFQQFLGAEVEERGGGTRCVCKGGGLIEGGWRAGSPHSDRLSLSVLAAATESCP